MTDTMTQPDQPTPDVETSEPMPDAEAPEQAQETSATPDMSMTASGIPVAPEEKGKGIKGEIKQIADNYVIPMSDAAIEEWVKILKDKDTEPFKKYVEQIAMGMYPTLAPQIQMGIPTRILLDPYIRTAEQILGPIAEEPNWSDPKWSAALQGSQDPKTGRPTLMPLDQWRKFVMQEPGHGFDASPMANDRAQAFSQMLHGHFNGRMS